MAFANGIRRGGIFVVVAGRREQYRLHTQGLRSLNVVMVTVADMNHLSHINPQLAGGG